jgi:hypothetical protein
MEFLKFLVVNNIVVIIAVLIALLVIFLIWNILLTLKLKAFQKKIRLFFGGKKISNLEELLIAQIENIKSLDKDIQELYSISNQINGLAMTGLHKVGMIRFNPFKDVGGDQSFAIALLNGENNGITLSSLYTREGTRIYSKAILSGKSEKYPLTEEEKKAIEIAEKSEIKDANPKKEE